MNALPDFLTDHTHLALVTITSALGSTPREAGAWMLVAPNRIFGTIGGGQLEFMAIDRAREMLVGRSVNDHLSVPLGPEIGQCCGGRVELEITVVDEAMRVGLLREAEVDAVSRAHIYLFGGGHVGHALAQALSLLPLAVTVVEIREEALEDIPAGVKARLTPVPEDMVRAAPAGSAFVVLTHDHALDFLIVAEALSRDDAAYVGMIGSATKKATFRSWYMKVAGGSETDFARLVCPIGGSAVRDKRPAVIAAMAAAEIMTALTVAQAG